MASSIVLVLLVLLAFCTPPAIAIVVPTDFSNRLDGFIRCLMSDRSPLPVNLRTPELAIAVVANNQTLLSTGYGSTSSGLPITADTLFAIASVSKAFTSTAAGMLADQGKLSLSERISRHTALKTYSAYVNYEASLRDLFTHHTGIQRADFIAAFHARDVDWRDMIQQYVPLLQPTLPFRYGYLYNNWIIAQAALVIERMIAVPWSEYITNMLLQPLGMANTTTSYKQSLSRNRATPYTNGASSGDPPIALPVEVDGWADLIAPAGAIHSTANDMSKWLSFHLGGYPHLIKQSTLDYLHSAEVTMMPPTVPFAQRGYATSTNDTMSVVVLGYGYNWAEWSASHSTSFAQYRDESEQKMDMLPHTTHTALLAYSFTSSRLYVRAWNGHAAVWHNGGLPGFISDLWFFPIDGFGWWIGVPNVSSDYFDLLAVWITTEMLGELNFVNQLCREDSSAAENGRRWSEVKQTLDTVLNELHQRRREQSFVPSQLADTAVSTPSTSEPAFDTAIGAVDPSILAGTYIDLVGPWGMVNVSLNGNNNATYPLMLMWEAVSILLTPFGDPYPNSYTGIVIAPVAAALTVSYLPDLVTFDARTDGTVHGIRFYLDSPVPYLTATAYLPNNTVPSSSSSSTGGSGINTLPASSSSTGSSGSGGSSATVERDRTVELVVVLCLVSIVLLVVVMYALLITKRYRELKSTSGAVQASDGSLSESLLTS